MSISRLNDVFRRIGDEVGFYTSDTFHKVPHLPGVYAWFYPLKILTPDLDDFVNEIQTVLNYDCNTFGDPEVELNYSMGWESFIQTTRLKIRKPNFNNYHDIWKNSVSDQIKFDQLRRIILRSSILLPPLYVGKTNNLYKRCNQHRNDHTDNNSFHNRFEEFARKNHLKSKRVEDLLFVTIKTSKDEIEEDYVEELLEAILKNLVKPKYSKQ